MKKIVALALCLVMVLGLMSGCQKAMDAKSVYQKMTDAMKNVTAMGADAEMDLEMKLSTMGVTMTVGLEMDMEYQAKIDMSAIYANMDMKMQAMGESEETKAEMYGTMDDGNMVYYIHESSEDMWIKTSVLEYADLMSQFTGTGYTTMTLGTNMTMEKGKQLIDGRKYYVLSEAIDGAAIQEQVSAAMPEMMSQMTGGEEMDEESMAMLEAVMSELDWSKLGGQVIYYVDDETFLPREMTLEITGLGDVFNGMIAALMEQAAAEYAEAEMEIPEFAIEVPTLKIAFKNMSYNDAVQIPAVPQEAIDNAIDADSLEDDHEDYEDYEEEVYLTNEPQADGSYLMTCEGVTVKVMVPAEYELYIAEDTMLGGLTEDMMNSISYMLLPETDGQYMVDVCMESVAFAQDGDYYLSHTEITEVDGFQTMGMVTNYGSSSWNAWKELDGGVLLVLTAEAESETFDLAGLIATVEIAVN